MPNASWETADVTGMVAAPPPPVTVNVRWSAGNVLVLAAINAAADAAPSRILTGLPHMVEGRNARYRRGTYGLMPESWGVVEDAQLTDQGSEWERRDDDLKVYGAGTTGAVYRLALSLRMPAARAMPEKGDQFPWVVRGETVTMTIFSAVERWEMEGLRMVDVAARHYTDMPNAIPMPPDDMVPQTLASSAFL